MKFLDMLKGQGTEDLDGVNRLCKPSVDQIRTASFPPCHHSGAERYGPDESLPAGIDVTSEIFQRWKSSRPSIPKSELSQTPGRTDSSVPPARPESFIEAVREKRPEKEIIRLVNFYDYLEIQPLGNNRFMIAKREAGRAGSKRTSLRSTSGSLRLGEQFQKPVVATCDVHFLNPEDEVYRRIIMARPGLFRCGQSGSALSADDGGNAGRSSGTWAARRRKRWLSPTRRRSPIWCERIAPVRPDKCPPVIPDSDKTLREICYNSAHAMYGAGASEDR